MQTVIKRGIRYSIQRLHDLAQREHILLTGRAAAGIWSTLRAWDFHNRIV